MPKKDFCPLEFQDIRKPSEDHQCLDGEPCNVYHCVFCVQNIYCLPKPKKMSRQCQKLHNRLLKGPVLNTELRDDTDLLEYRRRFKDLRDYHGIMTQKKSLGKGVYEYSLVQ